MSLLNEKQREAATFGGRFLLVLAGAGSGKTKTLVARIEHFVKIGYSPGSIIAVTFTNKAAREMRHRLQAVLGYDTAKQLWIGTFHGLSNTFLRKFGHWIDLPDNFQIITQSDQKRIFRDFFNQLCSEDFSAQKQKNILYYLSEYYRLDQWPTDRISRIMIERYLEYTRRQALVDFDSLIIFADKLFQRPEFQQQVGLQFKQLLVDEFQDTNPAQFRWIQGLLHQGCGATLVGDDDQSIYRFRGADLSIIQKADLMLDGLWTIRLEQNYRSTPSILNLANAVISKNKTRLGKTLWTQNAEKKKPNIVECLNEYHEAQELCRRIHQLLHQGVKHEDIAVLYRSHTLSRLIEAEARKYQWPYHISGGLPFFEREEIKDLMSYLQVIDNPNQEIALMRIINKPARKIGEKTQQTIREYADKYEISFWQAMLALIPGFTPQTQKAIKNFCTLIEEMRLLLSTTPSLALFSDLVIDRTNLLSIYDTEDAVEQKTDNLYQFHLALRDYQSNMMNESSENVLRSFLNDYVLDDRQDSSSSGITLSTCHAAKGLEWPYVFVVGCENDYFPHEQSQHDRDQIEEERRLFYVAITRARLEITLFFCRTRQKYQEMKRPEMSPFVKEIDPALLDWSLIQKPSWSSQQASHVAQPLTGSKHYSNQDHHKKILKHPVLGNGIVLQIDVSLDSVKVQFDRLGTKLFRYSLCKDFIQ